MKKLLFIFVFIMLLLVGCTPLKENEFNALFKKEIYNNMKVLVNSSFFQEGSGKEKITNIRITDIEDGKAVGSIKHTDKSVTHTFGLLKEGAYFQGIKREGGEWEAKEDAVLDYSLKFLLLEKGDLLKKGNLIKVKKSGLKRIRSFTNREFERFLGVKFSVLNDKLTLEIKDGKIIKMTQVTNILLNLEKEEQFCFTQEYLFSDFGTVKVKIPENIYQLVNNLK